jgi:hypothetical protein
MKKKMKKENVKVKKRGRRRRVRDIARGIKIRRRIIKIKKKRREPSFSRRLVCRWLSSGLLGRIAGMRLPKFHRCLLPPSSAG